jgi:hypothetical protein
MKFLTMVLVTALLLTGCLGVNGEPLVDELKAEAAKQALASGSIDVLGAQREAYYNGAFDTCMYHNLGVMAQQTGRAATDAEMDQFMLDCDEFAWDVIRAVGANRYGDELSGEVAPRTESAPFTEGYECVDCQNI